LGFWTLKVGNAIGNFSKIIFDHLSAFDGLIFDEVINPHLFQQAKNN
jgi:hypothetical protein